jgi:hypothetical protein
MAELNEKELAEMVADTVLDKFEYKGKTIREWVQDIAEADYVGKWIPVSERLPEDRREVLVTAYWHETYQVMMGSYYGDGLWWCVPFNNTGKHEQKLKPKAWMELPKAYKEKKDDSN